MVVHILYAVWGAVAVNFNQLYEVFRFTVVPGSSAACNFVQFKHLCLRGDYDKGDRLADFLAHEGTHAAPQSAAIAEYHGIGLCVLYSSSSFSSSSSSSFTLTSSSPPLSR